MAQQLIRLDLENATLAFGVGLLIVCVMVWEMLRAPWRPFFWATAFFTLAVPLFSLWQNPRPWLELFAWRGLPWPHIGAVFVLVLLWEAVLCSWLYERVVRHWTPRQRQAWSIDNATDAARAMGRKPSHRAEAISYGVLVFIWAPIAENLFYWGYLFRKLQAGWNFEWAVLGVVALFSARHAMHFLPIRPRPWPAMLAFALSVSFPAALNCLLFAKAGSLVPLILLHVIMNVILAWLYTLRRNA